MTDHLTEEPRLTVEDKDRLWSALKSSPSRANDGAALWAEIESLIAERQADLLRSITFDGTGWAIATHLNRIADKIDPRIRPTDPSDGSAKA